MANLDEIMMNMPKSWRYRWCTCPICCCLGCANISGHLKKLGFTRENWEDWVKNNPNPDN
jgi:hypothetical protein